MELIIDPEKEFMIKLTDNINHALLSSLPITKVELTPKEWKFYLNSRQRSLRHTPKMWTRIQEQGVCEYIGIKIIRGS